MNEVSPNDRLYYLVLELLCDGSDGLRPGEVKDCVDEAIYDWRATEAGKGKGNG